MKYLILIVGLTFLTSCQIKQVRTQTPNPPASTQVNPNLPSAVTPTNSTPTPVVVEPAPPTIPPKNLGPTKKLGLILGPGASLAYAHIGVLEELQKNKIPVEAIVGMEFSALPAALFASDGQAYSADWQMMKLKDKEFDSGSLLPIESKPADPMALKSFLEAAFKNKTAEQSKIKFACPAFNFAKKKIYMMNKGGFDQLLPYCLAFPPLFKSYKQNISALTDLKAAVEFLKASGANFIVYVNLLDGYSEDNPEWQTVRQSLLEQTQYVDYVLNVDLKSSNLKDFSQRRNSLEVGQQSTKSSVTILIDALGL